MERYRKPEVKQQLQIIPICRQAAVIYAAAAQGAHLYPISSSDSHDELTMFGITTVAPNRWRSHNFERAFAAGNERSRSSL
jgi:hypothetical protein